MDDKSFQALAVIANKVGTTTEYVFGILVDQAPITGTIIMFRLVLYAIVVSWWFRHVYVATIKEKRDWPPEAKFVSWVVIVISVFLGFVQVVADLPTAINALIHPEYWALSQILQR